MDTAIEEVRDHGVAVLADAASPEVVHTARTRLAEVTSIQREDGTAFLEDGSAADGRYLPGVNQRVVGLLDKGDVFCQLAAAPDIVAIVGSLFDDDAVLLSSVTANVANLGGRPMALHADQGFVPAGTRYPVLANAIWPLVDFTEQNGATRVVPGSHHGPSDHTPVTVTAAAGDVILLDGRTLHGTGHNTTPTPRPAIIATYCRPWVRPFANHLLDLPPATFAAMTSELRELLGCRQWFVHGFSELAYQHRTLDRTPTRNRPTHSCPFQDPLQPIPPATEDPHRTGEPDGDAGIETDACQPEAHRTPPAPRRTSRS